jgi:leader peptidase (prepilin peptidase)/N-methyltransferase
MPETSASWPYVVGLAIFVGLIAAVAVYDVRSHRIPNVVTYPAIVAATVFAFFNPIGPWYEYVISGVLSGAILALIALASRGGMGMGDAKLGVVVGLITGWPAVLVALFIAFASGAVVGVGLMAARRIGRGQAIPFAPALLVGTITALFVGRQVVSFVTQGMV